MTQQKVSGVLEGPSSPVQEKGWTEGPWIVALSGAAETLIRAGDRRTGQRIASTFVGNGTLNKEGNLRRIRENEANARLIAAAPDLVEALKLAVADELGNNWRPVALAALTKAGASK